MVQEDSLETEINVIAILFCALALIVVGTRVLVRLRIVRAGWGWDDTTIVLAMAMTICLSYFSAMAAYFGFGDHFTNFSSNTNLSEALKMFYLVEIFYVGIVSVTKLSILLFYLRLSVNTSFRRVVISFAILVSLYGIATVLAVILQCTPISLNWELSRIAHMDKCLEIKAFWTATGVLNIFSDLVVYILPIPMLWRVNRPQKQRVALVLVFAIGLFVVLAGVVRFVLVIKALSSIDIFYTNGPVLMWSSIEISDGLICACLPSLKPLISRFLPHLVWTYGSGHSDGSANKESTPYNSRYHKNSTIVGGISTKDSAKHEKVHRGRGIRNNNNVGPEIMFGRWSTESETRFDLETGPSITIDNAPLGEREIPCPIDGTNPEHEIKDQESAPQDEHIKGGVRGDSDDNVEENEIEEIYGGEQQRQAPGYLS